jgi:hypothetical protein
MENRIHFAAMERATMNNNLGHIEVTLLNLIQMNLETFKEESETAMVSREEQFGKIEHEVISKSMENLMIKKFIL